MKRKKTKEAVVTGISYVGYVPYLRFRAIHTLWSWAFWYSVSRYSAQYKYVIIRVLGFEFDGLVRSNNQL
jgi:hypothetical protein